MALLALSGMSLLLIALITAALCLGGASPSGHSTPPATMHFGAPAHAGNKQYANITVSAMGVHQVTSSAGCWPGVWVGPSPAVHAHPVVSPSPAPMQRRRPSGIAVRATSHGVLR
jgi:hypothetical protein